MMMMVFRLKLNNQINKLFETLPLIYIINIRRKKLDEFC